MKIEQKNSKKYLWLFKELIIYNDISYDLIETMFIIKISKEKGKWNILINQVELCFIRKKIFLFSIRLMKNKWNKNKKSIHFNI